MPSAVILTESEELAGDGNSGHSEKASMQSHLAGNHSTTQKSHPTEQCPRIKQVKWNLPQKKLRTTAAIYLYVGIGMAGIFKCFYLKLKNTGFTKFGIGGKFLSG